VLACSRDQLTSESQAESPALLAEACAKGGRVAEGLEGLQEALALLRSSRAFFYEAELHRLSGVLLQQSQRPGGTETVDASFQQAIEIARRQNTKSLELRACTSLGRLWQESGQSAEALALLRPVFDWFGEGRDTPDLTAARALLAELESPTTSPAAGERTALRRRRPRCRGAAAVAAAAEASA
jgi:tetratricopeptide (TPR) repeat protein